MTAACVTVVLNSRRDKFPLLAVAYSGTELSYPVPVLGFTEI